MNLNQDIVDTLQATDDDRLGEMLVELANELDEHLHKCTNSASVRFTVLTILLGRSIVECGIPPKIAFIGITEATLAADLRTRKHANVAHKHG
jgi:hypothetical protein